MREKVNEREKITESIYQESYYILVHTILVQDVGSRGGYVCMRGTWKISILSAHFAANLKLL